MHITLVLYSARRMWNQNDRTSKKQGMSFKEWRRISSTLIHSSQFWRFKFYMRVDETLMQALACQLSLQLFFSFDQDMRVDKILMQTLACHFSCNSCSRLTRTWELMKLPCKLSLVNSHATFVLVWPGHESWWNSHANSRLSTLMQLLFSFDQDMRVDETLMQTLACQLSCNSCSRLTRTWELMKLSCKLSLVNSHATLVLVWPGHES